MRIERDGSPAPFLVVAVALSVVVVAWAASVPEAGRPPPGAAVTALVLLGVCAATASAVLSIGRPSPRQQRGGARPAWAAAALTLAYAFLCLLAVDDLDEAPYLPLLLLLAVTTALAARRAERAGAAAATPSS